MLLNEVLQRGGHEKIFLSEPQLLSRRGLVAWVKNFRNGFCTCLLRQRSQVLPLVKRIEPHRVRGARGPQPHDIYMPSSPPHDRNVIRHRFDRLIRMPDRSDSLPSGSSLDATAIVDVIDHFWSFEL